MKGLIYASISICFLIATSLTSAQPAIDSGIVNLMIDADVPVSPTYEEGHQAEKYLAAMYQEFTSRDIGATIFATEDATSTYVRMRLTNIGLNPKFELGMSGNRSNEKLSEKSYSEQKSILQRTKGYTEACRICGLNEVTVRGFLPQSFDQNEDTYKVLDEIGITYSAGFQAGLIYESGHQNDVKPYRVGGHNIYAIPVSTYTLSGKRVPLHDKYFNDSGLSSSQWYEALVGKFDEAQRGREPVVILLTSSVSGKGEYLDALKQFMDYALSQDASFMTSMGLLNSTRPEGYQPPESTTSECTTCGQEPEQVDVVEITSDLQGTADSNNTTEASTAESTTTS